MRTHGNRGGGGDDPRGGRHVGAQHAAPLRAQHAAPVSVVGGGLAGCEAAWALATRGIRVTLHEMRPVRMTAAHQTDRLAELVCSNTFKSLELTNAHGLLKAEMRRLGGGSLVLAAADAARVPGGSALAVDRAAFADSVQRRLLAHPNVTLVRQEVTALPPSPAPAIIATGPLTSDALADAIAARLGAAALAFYDAIAPIVAADSLDMDRLFRASRYGKGTGDDYLNAPFTRAEYEAFIDAVLAGEQYQPGPEHAFDKVPYFEGCLPIEEMAARGRETLRFGPMKPVGLSAEAHAVVQLRQEDRAGQMWNLVGFQTRLKTGAQQRIFRMIPGLERAEFLRYGSIHRNSYLNAPAVLSGHLAARGEPRLLFAGQLTGVEGYTESAATGMLAGINLARLLDGAEPLVPPPTTMLGALYRYLRETDPGRFQPMNANFGLLEPLDPPVKDKQKKKEALAERALQEMDRFTADLGGPQAEAWAQEDTAPRGSDVPGPSFRMGT